MSEKKIDRTILNMFVAMITALAVVIYGICFGAAYLCGMAPSMILIGLCIVVVFHGISYGAAFYRLYKISA